MGFLWSAGIAAIATLLCLFLLPETHQATGQFKLSWQDFGLTKIARSATSRKFGRTYLLTFFSGSPLRFSPSPFSRFSSTCWGRMPRI
jgi:hypothetical protein